MDGRDNWRCVPLATGSRLNESFLYFYMLQRPCWTWVSLGRKVACRCIHELAHMTGQPGPIFQSFKYGSNLDNNLLWDATKGARFLVRLPKSIAFPPSQLYRCMADYSLLPSSPGLFHVEWLLQIVVGGSTNRTTVWFNRVGSAYPHLVVGPVNVLPLPSARCRSCHYNLAT